MKGKKLKDYEVEMEEITIPVPKNTAMISVVSVYTPNDMIGLNVRTDTYDTDDLIQLKGGKDE